MLADDLRALGEFTQEALDFVGDNLPADPLHGNRG